MSRNNDREAPAADQRLPGGFKWFNAVQFFGALNDNVFKLLLVLFCIDVWGRDKSLEANGLVLGVFVLPFLVFIAAGGVVADRWSKRNIVVTTKAAEGMIMLLGVVAFAFGIAWIPYVVLFLMACQSAFFGPSKLGIIPELVGQSRLSKANSFIEAFTYLAIILGTAAAPAIVQLCGGNYQLAAVFCVAFAGVGFGCSLFVPATPAAGSEQRASIRFWRDILRPLKRVRNDAHLVMAVVGAAYFFLLGAFMQGNLIPYGMEVLDMAKTNATYLFLFAAVGIGVGALIAGKVSGRHIEFGLVPLGALGLTITPFVLWLISLNSGSSGQSALLSGGAWLQTGGVGAVVVLMGISSGLFIVPLQAFIQYRSPVNERGEIIAASGFLSWVGVLLAAGLLLGLGVLGVGSGGSFLIMAMLTLVVALAAFRQLPDFLLCFLAVVLTRTFYRIRVLGGDKLPREGGALLVANHTSWADPLIILATTQRRVKFLMDRDVLEEFRWLKPLMLYYGVIPISRQGPPKDLARSLQAARKRLNDGYLVCVFAEGELTKTGLIGEFKVGYQRIVKGTGHPILPVYLGGLWGSIWSHYYGAPGLRMPRQLPYPVAVVYGDVLSPTATPAEVRGAVQELSVDYFNDRARLRRPLAAEFVRSARKRWSKQGINDGDGRSLTYGKALIQTLALGKSIKPLLSRQRYVGILMPPSIGGALANIAVSMLGYIPVNLNYTASRKSFESAISQCGIDRIISSRAFLKKLGMNPPEGTHYLEDISSSIKASTKVSAAIKAWLTPIRWLVPMRGFSPHETATVLFSSGATGTPKGVALSHHNLMSNIEQAKMVLRPNRDDQVCGCLPFFHSFGLMVTLWLPLLVGVGVSYYPNPLDGRRIGRLVREHQCTILLATPTFLSAYLKRANPEDFKSLRLCITGAEKLTDHVADQFEKRFGIRPVEGYGATELSPLVAVNLPYPSRPGGGKETHGPAQSGYKPGTVGRPVPGMAANVLDPDTLGNPKPHGSGLLALKGPNVMLGYLNQPEATAEVVRDGWYVTGDLATLDAEGFLKIDDRLSRFSKIGGEMIPHLAIEDTLLQGLNVQERVLAVSSVDAGDGRGERLVVVYTEEAGDAEQLHRILMDSNLPNLWKPGRDAYVKVDHIPILGSGKLDVKGLRALAKRGFEVSREA